MFGATRIRLYPTDEQAHSLAVQFGCARWVWNNALAMRAISTETGKGLNYHAMAIRLPKLKQEFEWLGDADSQALQHPCNISRARSRTSSRNAANIRASSPSMVASRSNTRSG